MKIKSKITMIYLMLCFVAIGVFASSNTAYAKKITSFRQAEKQALKTVKNATVTEVDKDYENGVLVYEIKLIKGTREYNITYRASDGKTLSYEWEENKINRKSKKAIIGQKKCKKLACKTVKNGTLVSIKKDYEHGVDVYEVKMKKGSKKYNLEYHARTGSLLEYKWEVVTKTSKKSTAYIGHEKAKSIALKKVPGAKVIKVQFDKDDGIPVYEVELRKGYYEYDIEIHAKTGKILDFDRD